MPTASDEQRNRMKKWFGGLGVGYGPPYAFLLARGWTEDRGVFRKPTSFYNPSFYEVECLLFLRNEWNYDFELPLYQEVSNSGGI